MDDAHAHADLLAAEAPAHESLDTPPLPPSAAPPVFNDGSMRLCVLASGSAGNCSVLLHHADGLPSVCLIDLGLSPKRTSLLLAELGLTLAHVDAVLITHLDSDHVHPGWRAKGRRGGGFLPNAHVFVHERHAHEAWHVGVNRGCVRAIERGSTAQPGSPYTFATRTGLRVSAILNEHDGQGSAAFRIRSPGGADDCAGGLGFATDLGHVTDKLIAHFAGVNVLAIESNYCPRLQHASSRPADLKARIMSGKGHLSNYEAADTARRIGTPAHVVLLHLSRQCNEPELAASLHAGAPYALTLTSQTQRTAWITVASNLRPTTAAAIPGRQLALFA